MRSVVSFTEHLRCSPVKEGERYPRQKLRKGGNKGYNLVT